MDPCRKQKTVRGDCLALNLKHKYYFYFVILIMIVAASRSIAKIEAAAAALTVQSLGAKPFVQRALANPMHPQSVISFFFGVDCTSEEGQKSLKEGACLKDVTNLWFQGGPDFDSLCQPFAEAVRAAGQQTLPSNHHNWNDSVDGLTAQVVLIDQLARNIFRGTVEAFTYEDVSIAMARKLTAMVLPPENDNDGSNPESPMLLGEIHPAGMSVLALALMHSETQLDHIHCQQLLSHATSRYSQTTELLEWWKSQTEFAQGHKDVVDRFGRYPHRNKLKDRESTKEELEWLADAENLPPWAKSQG